MKDQFLLNPTYTFLNHGSFGACPKVIFEKQQSFQREMESDPVYFIQKQFAKHLATAKEALAAFINCDPDDFVFTPNPTVAVNTIMRSLKLKEGDEILTTNHEYGAMDRTWHFYSKKSGVKYVRQSISLPVISKEQILAEFWQGLTPKTKIIFINQIASITALIFPVKEICDKARELGITTIIDGAHVPGHIDLDIASLNPDFYTGTLHKWMLAPKGSSFLYVKKEWQNEIEPLVVSWGYESLTPSESPFLDYHEYQGTNDHSAYLCTPTVIEFLQKNNWKEKSAAAKELVLKNYPRFCALLNSTPIAPLSTAFMGQMASVPIQTSNPQELKDLLYDKYKIQVPIMILNEKVYLRYSINAYNSQSDLDILYKALEDIIATTDLIQV
ncbi:aminotransferase class V-fold PLP-dependent enzyme [Flavobacterium antarcticum]|uniref:aminotransferase class V-fold PLP-dependent enzyme n=1 Tax=Flavobacterium antarcticum TaxID=271155 RepID=UPI0003B39E3E|nr:aminotransferase class V-fold PLP-dependent enzyme [Flavobacterium antarcticum]